MIPTMNASKTIDVNQTNKDDPPFKDGHKCSIYDRWLNGLMQKLPSATSRLGVGQARQELNDECKCKMWFWAIHVLFCLQ